MDYRDNLLCHSHANMSKVSVSLMERKCHQRYYINILVSGYLSFNWEERLAIDKAGSRLMGPKRHRRVLSIFKSQYLKYSKFLESERKFKLSISKKMWQHFSDPEADHIFSNFSGTYLVYIFFVLVCGNYTLTLERVRCSNLLSIDFWLNRINPSTNITFLSNAERGYRTKFWIMLEEVFQYII